MSTSYSATDTHKKARHAGLFCVEGDASKDKTVQSTRAPLAFTTLS
jgi:hypothetical protein